MNALSVRGLTKTYKNGVQALKGIDLEVEQGDFFALLGPNGAGKTTLIGIMTSLVTKTGGEAAVFGHDIDRELEANGEGSLDGQIALWEEGSITGRFELHVPQTPQIETSELSESDLEAIAAGTDDSSSFSVSCCSCPCCCCA